MKENTLDKVYTEEHYRIMDMVKYIDSDMRAIAEEYNKYKKKADTENIELFGKKLLEDVSVFCALLDKEYGTEILDRKEK